MSNISGAGGIGNTGGAKRLRQGTVSKFQKGIKGAARFKQNVKSLGLGAAIKKTPLMKRSANTAPAPSPRMARPTMTQSTPKVAPMKPYPKVNYHEVAINNLQDLDKFLANPNVQDGGKPIKLAFSEYMHEMRDITFPTNVAAVSLPKFAKIKCEIKFAPGSQCKEFSCGDLSAEGNILLPRSIENVKLGNVDGLLNFERGNSCQRIEAKDVNVSFPVPTNTRSVKANSVNAQINFQPRGELTHFKTNSVKQGIRQELPVNIKSVNISRLGGELLISDLAQNPDCSVTILPQGGRLSYPEGTNLMIRQNEGGVTFRTKRSTYLPNS